MTVATSATTSPAAVTPPPPAPDSPEAIAALERQLAALEQLRAGVMPEGIPLDQLFRVSIVDEAAVARRVVGSRPSWLR
ncbi:MAG: hypothetical protein H6713_42080 [Myxococcales bacterium]|nr:hypothetical protein [Myxococcales bacterium]